MVVMTSAQMVRRQARISGAPPQPSISTGVCKHDRRINPYVHRARPEGQIPCFNPCCMGVIELDRFEGDDVVCSQGHEFNLTREDHLRSMQSQPGAGGWTHSGLTLKQLGDIGERIVQQLGDFGQYGSVDHWYNDTDYKSPLDGRTDLRWGIEVKTSDATARNLAYNPGGPSQRARKNEFADQEKLAGILCIYVVVDFRTSLANVYVRAERRVVYFDLPDVPFASAIRFANPFVEQPQPEMPF